MLRFFQVSTTLALLGLTWLVFSADPEIGGDGKPWNQEPGDRNRVDRAAGSFFASESDHPAQSRELRSLQELLEGLAHLQEATKDVEFGPEDLPDLASGFLAGLRPEELTTLLSALIEPTHPFNGRDFWLKHLILHFGKVSPEDGLAFARGLPDSDHGMTSYLEALLYLGWASVDPRKAWESFQTLETSPGMTDDPFLRDRIGARILGELAKADPEKAVEIMTSSRGVVGDEEWGRGISFESRDFIISQLPDGMNWAEIARSTEESDFYPGEAAAFVILRGPGPQLFARWADESPAEAIAWFTKDRGATGDGFFQNDWGQLMKAWHERSPDGSISWIESQIVSGPSEIYLETLRDLLESPTMSEPAIRAARLLPDQEERFKILKLTASSGNFVGDVLRDPLASPQNPFSQEIGFVMKMIPEFQLSGPQVAEIKRIIGERESLQEPSLIEGR